MATVIDFPQLKHIPNDVREGVLNDTADLLSKYSMDRIILGLFHAASDPSEIAVIMPSFSKVVLDNERK